MKKFILTLPEYDRIFKTIYSVLEGRANTPKACLFFASAGALILNKYYKIPASAVGGAFMLCTESVPSVLVFGKIVDGILVSDSEGFHFWIQTESHVIDFMAPIFGKSIDSKGFNKPIPRKMFQRSINDEAVSPNDLSATGDYYTSPNPELTDEMIDKFLGRHFNTDLLLACDSWFKKHPKKMEDMSLGDDTGRIHKLQLSGPSLTGAW